MQGRASTSNNGRQRETCLTWSLVVVVVKKDEKPRQSSPWHIAHQYRLPCCVPIPQQLSLLTCSLLSYLHCESVPRMPNLLSGHPAQPQAVPRASATRMCATLYRHHRTLRTACLVHEYCTFGTGKSPLYLLAERGHSVSQPETTCCIPFKAWKRTTPPASVAHFACHWAKPISPSVDARQVQSTCRHRLNIAYTWPTPISVT